MFRNEGQYKVEFLLDSANTEGRNITVATTLIYQFKTVNDHLYNI